MEAGDEAPRPVGAERVITNVFVLMLENHSYDNVFGMSRAPPATHGRISSSLSGLRGVMRSIKMLFRRSEFPRSALLRDQVRRVARPSGASLFRCEVLCEAFCCCDEGW